ncbi:hypothetical protein BGZ58_010046 [Dissophora ornata]|nr:hypothetical protein BGZ58_010046 [Dissophora ornata]
MTRATTLLPLFVIAALAVFFASQAQAQTTSGKPECVPLHQLYKDWVAPCTKNGTAVPNADSDPAWIPCICKSGFFPLAVANEQCALEGTGKSGQITATSIDGLCQGQTGYVAANSQKPNSALTGALTSATSISQSLATHTTSAGASATSSASGQPNSATGMLSAGSDNMLMAMMVSLAMVVLATTAAL